MWQMLAVSISTLLCICSVVQAAERVVLVQDGVARVNIVLDHEESQDAPGVQPSADAPADQKLQWAAEDLAHYIHRMSGARLEVEKTSRQGLIPIHVRRASRGSQLPLTSKYGDAYMIDIKPDRIILQGESPRAAYYAAARLLHELGVRWYAPGELGEHVPVSATLSLPVGKTAATPDYHTRNLWGKGEQERRWLLRNRMGGAQMPQGHAFANFQRPLEGDDAAGFFQNNPDFFPLIDGKTKRFQANLSNPELHKHFAEHIRRRLDKGTRWAGGMGEGIGPDDGPILDERPESQGYILGRRDPMMQLPDATDLFIHYANGIARELEKDYSSHLLGFYVYSNHAGVPTLEKPHQMLLPIIAPITFSRYSSIGNPRVPTSMLLLDIITRWTELSDQVGFYLYNFNLADTAMPFTRTLTFSKDIPNLHRLGLRYGSIESMENWHTMVPGNYVLANLMWDVDADPVALANEVYENYYGPAANSIRQYNHVLEHAYENTDAHAGNLWAMHRILDRRVMEQLQEAVSHAEREAEGVYPFADRVAIIRHSLEFAEHWLAARRAMNAFRFEEAAEEAEAFLENHARASQKYPLFFTSEITRYFRGYHMPSFEDGRRVERKGDIVYRFPDTWKAYFDLNMSGHRMGLGDPRSLASNWIDLNTFSQTIDEQGFPHFRGLIWYRHAFEMPKAAAGVSSGGLFTLPDDRDSSEKIMLWFGGLDSQVHIYINGHDLGEHVSRNFGPVEVDITKVIRPGARNTIILAVNNSNINELGTGGIMRPMVIYQPR